MSSIKSKVAAPSTKSIDRRRYVAASVGEPALHLREAARTNKRRFAGAGSATAAAARVAT